MLKPLLERRGYTLTDAGADNYKLLHPATGELIIKANYWRSPESDEAGNAIDFLVKIERIPFAEAMAVITREPT